MTKKHQSQVGILIYRMWAFDSATIFSQSVNKRMVPPSYQIAGKCFVSWLLSILTIMSVSQSVCQSGSQSVSQSVSQSGKQAGSQSVSQAVCQAGRKCSQAVCLFWPFCLSVSQSVIQSDSQLVSQSVRQSVSQSVRKSISQAIS